MLVWLGLIWFGLVFKCEEAIIFACLFLLKAVPLVNLFKCVGFSRGNRQYFRLFLLTSHFFLADNSFIF